MKVREAIAALQRMPPDTDLGLTRMLAAGLVRGPVLELRLDSPIIGIAYNGTDALLVMEIDARLVNFGTLVKFGDVLAADLIGETAEDDGDGPT